MRPGVGGVGVGVGVGGRAALLTGALRPNDLNHAAWSLPGRQVVWLQELVEHLARGRRTRLHGHSHLRRDDLRAEDEPEPASLEDLERVCQTTARVLVRRAFVRPKARQHTAIDGDQSISDARRIRRGSSLNSPRLPISEDMQILAIEAMPEPARRQAPPRSRPAAEGRQPSRAGRWPTNHGSAWRRRSAASSPVPAPCAPGMRRRCGPRSRRLGARLAAHAQSGALAGIARCVAPPDDTVSSVPARAVTDSPLRRSSTTPLRTRMRTAAGSSRTSNCVPMSCAVPNAVRTSRRRRVPPGVEIHGAGGELDDGRARAGVPGTRGRRGPMCRRRGAAPRVRSPRSRSTRSCESRPLSSMRQSLRPARRSPDEVSVGPAHPHRDPVAPTARPSLPSPRVPPPTRPPGARAAGACRSASVRAPLLGRARHARPARRAAVQPGAAAARWRLVVAHRPSISAKPSRNDWRARVSRDSAAL